MISRIVPIGNQAGSVGKTTTTVALAALLAEAGQRVLVVDFDAQANATSFLGVDPDQLSASIGDVLLKRASLLDALVETSAPGVQLLPASRRLDADVFDLQNVTGREMRLRNALRDAPDHLDVVLVDCPGSMSLLTIAALVVATGVITVTLPSGKELEGIPRFEDTIADVAEAYNPGLRLGAVIPCIVPPANSGRLYQDALAMLSDAYGELVTPPVRKSVKAPEASSHRLPVPVYAPTEPITEDYRAVLKHLEQAGIL